MAQKVRASFTLVDSDTIEASTFIWASATDAATAAEINADVQALAVLLDKVVYDQITGIRVTLQTDLPATGTGSTQIKAAPHSASETERVGLFTFTAANTPKLWSFDAPGLSRDVGVVSGGKIVLGGTAPAELLKSGILSGGTVLTYANADTQALSALDRTRIGTHKHRKQRGKSSLTGGS